LHLFFPRLPCWRHCPWFSPQEFRCAPRSTPYQSCNIILPSMPRSIKWSLPSGFATEVLFYFSHSSPMSITCPVSFIVVDLMIKIIFGGEYKLWPSSLCCFLPPPLTST
jgi:hypothetical protein